MISQISLQSKLRLVFVKLIECVPSTAAIAVFALLVATTGVAADWGPWRGPNHDGISTETSWNPRALSTAKIVWRAELGMGHSTVAVVGNRVYSMGSREISRGGKTALEDVVYCFHADTGREIWHYSYPVTEQRWPGPGTTPVVVDGRVYTTSREGHFFAIDAATGSVQWRHHLVDEGLTVVPQWGFCASVLVLGNRVIVNAGESGLAFDARNGKVLWKSEPEAGGLATPVPLELNGKPTVAILGRAALHLVDAASGAVHWQETWDSYADPVLAGKDLYLPAGRARGKRGARLFGVTASGPELKWQTKGTNYAFQSSVVLDGFAYGFRREEGDYVDCVDLSDGSVKWTEAVGDWGSLAAAGNHLVIIKGDGELVVAKATPEKFTPVSSTKVFQLKPWRTYPDGKPDTCWSAPVLANGRIYARSTYGKLVCVDVS